MLDRKTSVVLLLLCEVAQEFDPPYLLPCRLSDLPPLPRAGSGRLPPGIGQPPSGQATISRPTPIPASTAAPFAVQQNAAAAAAEAMVARGSSTADPVVGSGGLGSANGGPAAAGAGTAVAHPVASGGTDVQKVEQKMEEAPVRWRSPDNGQTGMQVGVFSFGNMTGMLKCDSHFCAQSELLMSLF